MFNVLYYTCLVARVEPIPYDAPKPSGHTRFVCVSDTHSRTDGMQMPYGDVLLHTGDFTELGLPSEVKKFNDWLGKHDSSRYCALFYDTRMSLHYIRVVLYFILLLPASCLFLLHGYTTSVLLRT